MEWMRVVLSTVVAAVSTTFSHHQGLGCNFTSTFGSTSGFWDRITTSRGLGRMFPTVLTGSTMITFDMRTLATRTGCHG